MGDVVNLRLARKQRVRDEAATAAQANRAKFGRTKAQKALDAKQADRAARHLDGARRERDPVS